MKTLKDAYLEIMNNAELKNEFFSLRPRELSGFMKTLGVKASSKEIRAYFNAQMNEEHKSHYVRINEQELLCSAGSIGLSCLDTIANAYAMGNMNNSSRFGNASGNLTLVSQNDNVREELEVMGL